MARRRTGQEQLSIAGGRPRGDMSLDEVSRLVDWTETDRLLVGISAAVLASAGTWPGVLVEI